MFDEEGYIQFEGDFFVKSYRGGFEDDKFFCNYGIVKFSSGDVYEGFFDKEHGKSKMGLYFHGDEAGNLKEHFFPYK